MTKQLSRVSTMDEEIETAIARGEVFDQHFTPAVAAEYIVVLLSSGSLV